MLHVIEGTDDAWTERPGGMRRRRRHPCRMGSMAAGTRQRAASSIDVTVIPTEGDGAGLRARSATFPSAAASTAAPATTHRASHRFGLGGFARFEELLLAGTSSSRNTTDSPPVAATARPGATSARSHGAMPSSGANHTAAASDEDDDDDWFDDVEDSGRALEGETQLLTTFFPLFSDLYAQMREADPETAAHAAEHYALFLRGPPNVPTRDRYGLLSVVLAFLGEVAAGTTSAHEFGF